MRSLVLKPMSLNLEYLPKCSFNLFQECNLNCSVWNSLASTSEVIRHMGPLYPLPKGS